MTHKERYRRVSVRMWGDQVFRALSKPKPNAQTLWLYLLTGPETSVIPGVIIAGELTLADGLGWSVDGLRKAFREVLAKGLAKASSEARLIWLPKAMIHNPPASPNVVTFWERAWHDLPECSLKNDIYQAIKAFVEGLPKGFQQGFTKDLPDTVAVAVAVAVAGSGSVAVAGSRAGSGAGEHPRANHALDVGKQEEPGATPPLTPLASLWNTACPTLPPVVVVGKSRRAKERVRLKERSISEWRAVFERLETSTFCHGTNDRGWIATYDWIIANDVNSAKTLEGKYDDRKPQPRGGAAATTGKAGNAQPGKYAHLGTVINIDADHPVANAEA